MRLIQWVAWAINLPCQAILLNSLVRGRARAHPILFSYVLVLFMWTVANIAASEGGKLPATWALAYWIVDQVAEWLLYCLVLSLIWRVLKANPNRARVVRLLVVGVALVWLAALILSHSDRPNQWMTNFTKYTAFTGALMNLVLWAALVRTRHPDKSVLMISGGYGLLSAGEAISQSLRGLAAVGNRTSPLLWAGNLTGAFTHSLCLLIWWRAIERERQQLRAGL